MEEKIVPLSSSRKIIRRVVIGLLVPTLIVWAVFAVRRSAVFTKGVSGTPLEVCFIDVGQGESILITTPGGRHILIDGGLADSSAMDFLRKKGVSRLEMVVLTHPDHDHVDGLIEVLENTEVAEVLDPGIYTENPEYARFLSLIEEKSITYTRAYAGQWLIWDDKVRASVLAPLVHYSGTGSDANNSSVVIRMVYGDISFLFTGDIEAPAELDLMDYGKDILSSTIMKSPHHGSYTSSTSPFLDWVEPQAVVISVGRGNPWGLPHPQVAERYRDYRFDVFRTDWDRTVCLVTDGKTWKKK